MKLLKTAPVLLLALVFVLTGCAANTPTATGVSNEAAPAPAVSKQETVTTPDTHAADEATAEVTYITAFEAESAALTNAGVPADSVLGLRSEFDRDDRVKNYDVDFCFGEYEYDYEINAVTGEVLRVEKGLCDHAHTEQTNPENGEKIEPASFNVSREEAKSIAFKHAGVPESSVKRLEIEYDRDKGVYKYEVSFDCDGYEYDYDIDAKTGNIIRYEKEWDD